MSHEVRLELGQVVTTKEAIGTLSQVDIVKALRRHQSGDWGEMSPQDKLDNNTYLIEGDQVMSKYTSEEGIPFYVITEWDRSVTTVLLTHEY